MPTPLEECKKKLSILKNAVVEFEQDKSSTSSETTEKECPVRRNKRRKKKSLDVKIAKKIASIMKTATSPNR